MTRYNVFYAALPFYQWALGNPDKRRAKSVRSAATYFIRVGENGTFQLFQSEGSIVSMIGYIDGFPLETTEDEDGKIDKNDKTPSPSRTGEGTSGMAMAAGYQMPAALMNGGMTTDAVRRIVHLELSQMRVQLAEKVIDSEGESIAWKDGAARLIYGDE